MQFMMKINKKIKIYININKFNNNKHQILLILKNLKMKLLKSNKKYKIIN